MPMAMPKMSAFKENYEKNPVQPPFKTLLMETDTTGSAGTATDSVDSQVGTFTSIKSF